MGTSLWPLLPKEHRLATICALSVRRYALALTPSGVRVCTRILIRKELRPVKICIDICEILSTSVEELLNSMDEYLKIEENQGKCMDIYNSD